VDLLKPLADEKNVTLQFSAPESFPSILGNRETLHMLFTNLIHNAIKYNRTDGRVEVTLEEDDHQAKVSVRDNGMGISEEEIPFVFEPFYRAKSGKDVQGSGLGLSIAKRIVEAHSGSITVDSKVGEGTVFRVFIP